MDPKDRRLLAEVLRWAYSQGWRHTVLRYEEDDEHEHEHEHVWANDTRRVHLRDWTRAEVFVEVRRTDRPSPTKAGAPAGCAWADSATVFVDLLVALRILPAVFSSAFHSGQSLGLYLGGRMPCVHDAVKVGVGA